MAWRWPWEKPKPPIKPPKVAGTRAPNQVLAIGFDKPHDYYFHFAGSRRMVAFTNCLLVGFTTPIEDRADVPSAGEAWYDRWLVLRRPDGRLAYVPRNGLLYIEESVGNPEEPRPS